MKSEKLILVLIMFVCCLLAACSGSGDSSSSGDSVGNNGQGEQSNTAPIISGAPRTTASVNQPYAFSPLASDPDADELTFSIINLPSWAAFNPHSGALSGIPSNNDIGTYHNILIMVSDGQYSAELPQFSIFVSAAPQGPAIAGCNIFPQDNMWNTPIDTLAVGRHAKMTHLRG